MSYLTEAFQKLNLLTEDEFDLSIDKDKVDELKSFVADDIDVVAEEPIIDVNAETEQDLQDNYIGKVILECGCCHARIYKGTEEVVLDDESGMANIEEECPVCGQTCGYAVIGEIKEFNKDANFESEEEEDEVEADVEPVADEEPEEEHEEEDEDEVDDDEITEALKEALGLNDLAKEEKEELEKSALTEEKEEICPECGEVIDDEHPMCDDCKEKAAEKEEEEEVDEACKESLQKVELASEDSKKLDEEKECDDCEDKEDCEDCKEEKCDEACKNESLTEEVHDVEVKTENGDVEVSKDGDKVTVDFAPAGEEAPVEETGEEMIAPLADDTKAEIENNEVEPFDDSELATGDVDFENEPFEDEMAGEEEVEEEPAEEEEVSEEDEEELLEAKEFVEESFDHLSKTYLRRIYENVNSYKTTTVSIKENKLVIEGLITFESGKEKKTTFVFENAQTSKRGKTILEGKNETFSNSNKAFRLKGVTENDKFVCEALTYNYTAKQLNESNAEETVKIYGRVLA